MNRAPVTPLFACSVSLLVSLLAVTACGSSSSGASPGAAGSGAAAGGSSAEGGGAQAGGSSAMGTGGGTGTGGGMGTAGSTGTGGGMGTAGSTGTGGGMGTAGSGAGPTSWLCAQVNKACSCVPAMPSQAADMCTLPKESCCFTYTMNGQTYCQCQPTDQLTCAQWMGAVMAKPSSTCPPP